MEIRMDGATGSAQAMARRNITEAMKARRLTQAELSERMHQTQPWISKHLKGPTRLTVDDLELFATALEVPLYSLLCEDAWFATFDRRRGIDRRRIPRGEELDEQSVPA